MSVWESRCEDSECRRVCHLSAIRSVSVSLFSARLDLAAEVRGKDTIRFRLLWWGRCFYFLYSQVSVSGGSAKGGILLIHREDSRTDRSRRKSW